MTYLKYKILILVVCILEVQANLYNITVHMSDEEFEAVDGYLYIEFVGPNFSEKVLVSQRLDTFKPRTIVSNTIDLNYPIDQIDHVLFEWEMPIFRPLRHWLRKPFITIRMVQLTPMYINDSLARDMLVKHFESDFGPVRARLDEWYKLDNLMDNEIIQ